MGHRKVIENYYSDINSLVDLLCKLINSYRLLVGGVGELNTIALAHKSEVKQALKRVDKMGEIIDRILEVVDSIGDNYMDYCKLKTEVIKCHMEIDYIKAEIDNELRLKE